MALEMDPPHLKLFIITNPPPPPPCVTKMFKLLFVEKGNYSQKKNKQKGQGIE